MIAKIVRAAHRHSDEPVVLRFHGAGERHGVARIVWRTEPDIDAPGQRFGAPMLLVGLFSQLGQASLECGLSEKDTVSFYEIMRRMAGLPMRVD